jgi:hypothetical protein
MLDHGACRILRREAALDCAASAALFIFLPHNFNPPRNISNDWKFQAVFFQSLEIVSISSSERSLSDAKPPDVEMRKTDPSSIG